MNKTIILEDADTSRNVHIEIVERDPDFAIIRFGRSYTLALCPDDLDSLAETLIAAAKSLRE